MLTAVAAAPTVDPFDIGTFAERGEFPLPRSTRPAGYEGYSWQHFLKDATDSTVRVALASDDARLAAWFDEWVIDVAAGRYGITVERIPVPSAAAVVEDLTDGRSRAVAEGTVDLVWVQGQDLNRYTDKDLLYGPWTSYTPSRRYLDPGDASLSKAFGGSTDGGALPWGRAQFVMLTDSARVPTPPTTWPALFDWITAHPGRFTYPAPPDVTGSAFVRQACMALAADAAAFSRPTTSSAAEDALEPCWDRLNALEPSLWRQGEHHPQSLAELEDLFALAEIDFAMRYNPSGAAPNDATDTSAATTRAFVFDEGTVASTHFLAIPYNAPNKPGAMVLANFLLSPEAQFAKVQPDNWGDLTVLSLPLIPEHWRTTFDELPEDAAMVPPDVLAAHRLDEPHRDWITAIDAGWEAAVRQR